MEWPSEVNIELVMRINQTSFKQTIKEDTKIAHSSTNLQPSNLDPRRKLPQLWLQNFIIKLSCTTKFKLINSQGKEVGQEH